jgi:hypothetical protein
VARNQTANTARLDIEIASDLRAEFDAFRARYGHTARQEVELALRRHMDSPPPVPPPPAPPPPPPVIPPLPPMGQKRGRGRPKKNPAK